MLTLLPLLGLAQADPPTPEALARICADRTPCEHASHHSAGTDPMGFDLQVVELLLSSGVTPEEARGAVYGGPCHPMEHHLVRYRGDEVVDSRLLVETCNDGYGASGMGEDSFTVGPNTFSHAQHGGSAWRWSEGTLMQLSPEKLLKTDSSSYFSPSIVESSSSWDWRTMQGRNTWSTVVCGEEEDGTTIDGSGVSIPLVPAHGTCAAAIDSTDTTGLIVHGKPGPAADATMRVSLATDNTLVVEVTDDTFVREAKSWLYEDHVELWLPAGPDPGDMHCARPWAAHQWAVRLDGSVESAHGSPDASALSAVVTTEGKSARWTITLPSPRPERLTVVYSDGDTGKTQGRLLATSALRFGDAHSLAFTRDFTRDDTCTPAGELGRRWDPRFEAVFGTELSGELREATLELGAVKTSADWHAAWKRNMGLIERATEPAQKHFETLPEGVYEPFDWALPALPGWHAGVYGEGSTLIFDLAIEPWAAAASATPEPDDDAFVSLMAAAWGDASFSSQPDFRTQTWDGGGCNDLGNGEHNAVLELAEQAAAHGDRFAEPIGRVRARVLTSITGETWQYPFCRGSDPGERTQAELEGEVGKILAERTLTAEEREALTKRLAAGILPGDYP